MTETCPIQSAHEKIERAAEDYAKAISDAQAAYRAERQALDHRKSRDELAEKAKEKYNHSCAELLYLIQQQ